ncbi:MAG: pilus assembly protein PilM [Bacillota bacterium]|uniref:pilus assembly protein PilM n=1 Tax=Desulforudis sp. DRI-14 TaxID=3459793 RepID=UPI003472CD1E
MLKGKDFTAVDIDSGEIKIAVLSSCRHGVVCRLLHRHPGPGTELLEGGGIDELAAVLRAALKSAPGAGKRVITAIDGRGVIIRQLRLPVMPQKELEQAAVWEAERLVPLPVDELILRPVVLGDSPEKEKGQINVLLAAVQKEIVYGYYEAFKRAGLKITAIDLQHLALWRVFHSSFGYPVHDGGVRAVLNLGFSSGQFIVLKGQELVYLRTIPVELGGLLPYGVVEPPPGGPEPYSEEIKAIKGEAAPAVEHPPGGPTRLELADFAAFADLVREIRRSLDFYQLQERDNPVATLVMTGNLSKITGLSAFLAGELGIKVEAGFPVLPFRDVKQPSQALDPVFSVAVGLALREVVR